MISIILPIYNTREYLGQCIESLLNQTYEDLEIICVDDGSTDGSELLADKYAEADDRIVVIHQNNQGESRARNVALSHARGEYIAFCDCDDWIEPDMYETLLHEIDTYGLDMAAGGWCKDSLIEDSWISESVLNEKTVTTETFDRNQLLEYLYERDSYRGFSYMWNKLYRRETLTDSSGKIFMFNENLKIGGDVIYLAQIALNSDKVRYVDRSFYHYRIRQGSGSHSGSLSGYRDWLRAYDIVIDLYERNKVDKRIISYLRRFKAYHALNAAKLACERRDEDALSFFQEVMRDNRAVYEELNYTHADWIEDYRRTLEVRI